VCRGARPGPGWWAHGYARRRLWVLHDGRVTVAEIFQQRWLDRASGRTRQDCPARAVPWSRYGLVVVFAAVWAWLSSDDGLYGVRWPWAGRQPARRTVQRWLARLLAEAAAWQAVLRAELMDRLAPRVLDEVFPGGLDPPRGVARLQRQTADQGEVFTRAVAMLRRAAPLLKLTQATLLCAAHRRKQAQPQR